MDLGNFTTQRKKPKRISDIVYDYAKEHNFPLKYGRILGAVKNHRGRAEGIWKEIYESTMPPEKKIKTFLK